MTTLYIKRSENYCEIGFLCRKPYCSSSLVHICVFHHFQGFLVESKLNKLLAPLEKDERSLMKLDAIFSVSIIFAAALENQRSAYAKTKLQISCAVTVQLISAFVFAQKLVQYLFFLNPKFQGYSLLLRLYRPVCVGPGRNPILLVFSRAGSYLFNFASQNC